MEQQEEEKEIIIIEPKTTNNIFWNDYLPNEMWGFNCNGDYVRQY